jgi:hypothetical protein
VATLLPNVGAVMLTSALSQPFRLDRAQVNTKN